MAKIIKEISLETSKPNLIQAIVAKQNDCNSRFLKVSIFNQGTQIPILPTSTVTINAQRNDGESKSFLGEVSDGNTAIVPLHSWMLEREGLVNCDVSIIDAESSKLTTTSFSVMVEKAACPSEDISTDPEYNILVDLIAQINELKQNYANALKGSSHGNSIALKDVSPVPHELKVQTDAAATVTKYGKNLLPPGTASGNVNGPGVVTMNGVTIENTADGSIILNGTPTKAFGYTVKYTACKDLPAGTTITISSKETAGQSWSTYLLNGKIKLSDGVTDKEQWMDTDGNRTKTIQEDYGGILIYISVFTGAGELKNVVFRPMIEVGNMATDFEEYRNPLTYTADENGAVHGIIGSGENITLLSKSDLSAEYNRDLNKAFAALNAAILNA